MARIGYLRFGEPCKHPEDMLTQLEMVNLKTKKRTPVPYMYQCKCGSIVNKEPRGEPNGEN